MNKVWALAAMFLAGLGVVLGVAASIPMVLIVMLFLAHRDKPREQEAQTQQVEPRPFAISGPSHALALRRQPGEVFLHRGHPCIMSAEGEICPIQLTE